MTQTNRNKPGLLPVAIALSAGLLIASGLLLYSIMPTPKSTSTKQIPESVSSNPVSDPTADEPRHEPPRITAQDISFASSTEKLPSGESVELIRFQRVFIFSLQYSPDGSDIAVIFRHYQPLILDTKTWVNRRGMPALQQIAFSPDGKKLATAEGSDGARLWDRHSPLVSTTYLINDRSNMTRQVGFSPSGKLVATANDNGVVGIWDVETCQKLRDLTGHTEAVLCVQFASDGKRLYSGGKDGKIVTWDTETWQANKVVNGPESNAVIDLAVLSDGSALAAVHHKLGVMIWNTNNWNASIHRGYNCVAAPHLGKQFALGGRDVLLTDGRRSSERHLRVGDIAKPVGIAALSFTPKDDRLACGDQLGDLRIVTLN